TRQFLIQARSSAGQWPPVHQGVLRFRAVRLAPRETPPFLRQSGAALPLIPPLVPDSSGLGYRPSAPPRNSASIAATGPRGPTSVPEPSGFPLVLPGPSPFPPGASGPLPIGQQVRGPAGSRLSWLQSPPPTVLSGGVQKHPSR